MAVGVGEGADGGEAVQGPVEQGGQRDVLGRFGGRFGPGAVRDLAALGAQFLHALLQEVQELGDRDGAVRELEQGQQLRDGFDHLGPRGGGQLVGARVDQRPGVEERHPAAQHGGVVPVPGAQAPAGAGHTAVHLDETGEAGGVPVGADFGRGQPQLIRGAGGGRLGERALPVGGCGRLGRGAAARQGRLGPAGDPDGVGQALPRHRGEAGPGRGALGRAGGGPAGPAFGDRGRGGGEGSWADDSEPGVARDTGRHGGSLPGETRKSQTEAGAGLLWAACPLPGGAWDWALPRLGPFLRCGGFASPSLVASGAGRAGVRRGWASRARLPVVTLRVTDWPQAPAGLLVAVRLDRAGHRWPQTPAGL
ncbi:hypothetical protein GCM10010295_63480 [Streptomyces intermedius]